MEKDYTLRQAIDNWDATQKSTILSLETEGNTANERGVYKLIATPKNGGEGYRESGIWIDPL